MKVEFSVDDRERLAHLFTEFKLSYLASESSIVFERAGKTSALPILLELAEGEKEVRFARRTQRLLKAACLPLGKTLETLDETKLHPRTVTTLRELASGVFLENGDNALFYGPPGRGKTHAAIAIADAIARTGRSVYFTPTFRIVQELLAARRDLSLPKALRKLDSFELLVCQGPAHLITSRTGSFDPLFCRRFLLGLGFRRRFLGRFAQGFSRAIRLTRELDDVRVM